MRYLVFTLLLIAMPVFGADTILAPTADAGTSSSFTVPASTNKTIIIYAASGLTAAEYSDVQISHDGGTTFADLYVDGAQVRLHSTNTSVTVYGPGIFRVDMDDPTNATGIYVSSEASL